MTDDLKYLTTPIDELSEEEKNELWTLYKEFAEKKGFVERFVLNPDYNPASVLDEIDPHITQRITTLSKSEFWSLFEYCMYYIPINFLLPFNYSTSSFSLSGKSMKPSSLKDIFYCLVCAEYRRQNMEWYRYSHINPGIYHYLPPVSECMDATHLHKYCYIKNMPNERIVWLLVANLCNERFSLPELAYYIHKQMKLEPKPLEPQPKPSLWKKLKNFFN